MQHQLVVPSDSEGDVKGEVAGDPGPLASAQSAAAGPELCLHTSACLLFSVCIA